MGVPTVHVASSDRALRRALSEHLARSGELAVVGLEDTVALAGPALVIVPATDCPPEVCRELTLRGVCVVVLAALPGERERDDYLRAGAVAYVPMLAGSSLLKTEIRRVLRVHGIGFAGAE